MIRWPQSPDKRVEAVTAAPQARRQPSRGSIPKVDQVGSGWDAGAPRHPRKPDLSACRAGIAEFIACATFADRGWKSNSQGRRHFGGTAYRPYDRRLRQHAHSRTGRGAPQGRSAASPRFAHSRATEAELSLHLAAAERYRRRAESLRCRAGIGRLVGEADRAAPSPRLVIMTCGGPGLMEAGEPAAPSFVAKSVGPKYPILPHEQFPSLAYVTPDLCFRSSPPLSLLRELHLLLRAKALVAFPGGYGTFDELFEVLTLVQTRKIKPIPVVLVGEQFLAPGRRLRFFGRRRRHRPGGSRTFLVRGDGKGIWNGILDWYKAAVSRLLYSRGRIAAALDFAQQAIGDFCDLYADENVHRP